MTEAHDTERKAFHVAVGVAIIMVGQLVASQDLRDGFFLSQFEPTVLPSMVVSGSILSLFFVFVSSRLFRYRSPASVLPFIFVLNGLFFVGEWALIGTAPRVIAVALYLHVASLGSVLISAFWSVVNERFDPRSAKRLIGRIGGGATFGGMLGGLAVVLGASTFDISTMILGLGALSLVCAVAAARIGDVGITISDGDDAMTSAVEIFEGSPYLRSLALLVALGAFGQTVYDYVFKAKAAAYFETGAELVSFFALFHLSIGVLTFLIQNLLANRLLARFGLAVNVWFLPGSSVVLGLGALLFPGLSSAAAMRGGIGVVENSLFRSGYELLYTPVSPEKKRPTKPLIDVGGDKIGTAMAGAVTFLLIGIFPVQAHPLLICTGIAMSLASFAVTRRLQQGYVSSLAARLRSGALHVDDVPNVDATTRHVLSDTIIAWRQQVVPNGPVKDSGASGDQISLADLRARLRSHSLALEETPLASLASERRPLAAAAVTTLRSEDHDPILISIADLRSGDPGRVSAALTAHHPLPRELIAFVIPLLGDEGSAEIATMVLKRVAPANTGALLDSVLQSRTPLPVRRKLCTIFGQLPTQRSVNGLVELLRDTNFELRFRAADSLLEIQRSNPKTRFPREFLFSVAGSEAANCRRIWRSLTSLDAHLPGTNAIGSTQGRRVRQGMTFVATLLQTLLDPGPLTLAIRGLASDVGGQRGTALEYLENVLPTALFGDLSPLLEDPRLTRLGMASRADILSEIAESDAREGVNLAVVREQVDAARNRSAKLREGEDH